MKKHLFIVLMLMNASVYSEILLKPFVTGSFSRILEQHQQDTFALIFWSIDCPSCYKELEMLSELGEKKLNMDIVLVSTDIAATNDELKSILVKYTLDKIELWKFSGDSDEQLRFEIDRSWYGELPRSYIFKASKQLYVKSGVISEEKLIYLINN